MVDPFSLGLGALQTGLSLYKLNKLGKEKFPSFDVSSEMQNAYGRAEAGALRGYSGAEESAFQQNLARSNRLGLQRGLDIAGGNLGQAVNAASTSQNVGALNQFSAQDAALKRQNIRYADTLAQALQRQKNLETQNKIQRRQGLERAYGGALQRGLENIVNPLNATAAFNYLKGGKPINIPNFTGNQMASDFTAVPISTPSQADLYGQPAQLNQSGQSNWYE